MKKIFDYFYKKNNLSWIIKSLFVILIGFLVGKIAIYLSNYLEKLQPSQLIIIGTGLIFFIILTISILTKNGVLAIAAILFSTVLGRQGQLEIAGRTPYLFWVEAAVITIIILWLIRASMSGKITWRKSISGVDTYLFLYLLVILGGLLIYPPIDYLRTGAILKTIFFGILVYFLAKVFINNKSKILLFSKLIPLTTLIFIGQFIYFIIQRFGLHFYYGTYEFHAWAATSWGRSNYLAAFFALFFALNLGVFLSERKMGWKIFSGLMSFSSLCFAIIISSRGAFLSIIIGIIFYWLFLPGKTIIKTSFMLFLILILLLSPLSEYTISRFSTGLAGRAEVWRDTFNIFLNYPLIGTGIGNKGFILLEKTGEYDPTAHNFILRELVETGFIGTFFLLLFYGKILIESFRLSRNKFLDRQIRYIFLGVTIALIIGFSHALVEPNLMGEQYRALFWFLLGFTAVSGRILHRESHKIIKENIVR